MCLYIQNNCYFEGEVMERWQSGDRINRENNYNVLRMLGASAVMYGHMFVIMGVNGPTLYANAISSLGFKLLMVLSGYMITQSCIYDGKASHFFIKRCFRLFPALLFYTLTAICILGPLFSALPVEQYFQDASTWRYLKNLIFIPQYHLPGVFASNPYPSAVNGSLWGLPVEVFCYILIFFILKILCRLRYRKELLMGVTFCICFLDLFRLHFYPQAFLLFWGVDLSQFLVLMPYFFIGSLFAVTSLKQSCNIQIAFLCVLISSAFHSKTYIFYELLVMLLLPYVAISFGECAKPAFASWMKRTDLTFGLFLWGFVVQQILVDIMIVRLQISVSPNMMFLLSFLFSSFLAYLTWHFVEKPASVFMKKLLH